MASIDRTTNELSTLSLYKYKSNSSSNQNERRREILKRQKEKRDSIVSQFRFSSLENQIDENEEKKSIHWPPKSKKSSRNSSPIEMMLAEWLFSRPEDFSSWFVIPIPKGQRCLVVHRSNQTEIFNKNQRFIRTISTTLPRQTILFCIFDSRSSIYHIVDLIMWNGQDYSTQIECQCRFFVLSSLEGDRRLDRQFQILPRWNIEQIEEFPFCEDGYLFYHPLGFYQSGYSPLVCWLQPFLVEEILQMKLSFPCEKPLDYTSAENYMMNEQTHRRKSSQRKTLSTNDETMLIDDEENLRQ